MVEKTCDALKACCYGAQLTLVYTIEVVSELRGKESRHTQMKKLGKCSRRRKQHFSQAWGEKKFRNLLII